MNEWARLSSRYGTSGVTVSFILAAAVLLRLPNLGESLWYDEVLYSTRFVANSLPRLWELVLNDPPAPLYRFVLYGWARLFGENEIVVRIPSLVCGIATIFLTYVIATKNIVVKIPSKFRTSPLLAALFLCFSPTHVWYSQEATAYAMTMCFLLVTILVWHELKSGTRAGHWYFFYGFFLICAIFTHFLAAIYLLALTVLLLDASPVARKRIIAINLVAGALAVSMIAVKYQLGTAGIGHSFLRPFTLFEWWMLFFNWFLHGNSIWTLPPGATVQDLMSFPLLVCCQIFFLVILAHGLVSRRGKVWDKLSLEMPLFLIALPLAIFLLTVVGYQKIYIERYLIIVLPFFAITLIRGATEFSNRYVSWLAMAAVVMLGAISYAMFLSKSDEWTVYKQNPDMRGAARYLATQNISADDAMIVFPTYEAVSLAFYIDRAAPHNHAIVQTVYDPAKVDQGIAAGKLKAIYAVKRGDYAYPVGGGDFQRVYGLLAANQRLMLTATRSFKGVHVYTFVPR